MDIDKTNRLKFRFWILVIMIVATLLCFVSAMLWPTTLNRNFTSEFKKGREKPVFSNELNDERKRRDVMSFLYQERKKEYEASIKLLDLNFKLHAVLILTSLLVLFNRKKEITLPIVNVKVSISWMFVFAPLVLLYIWLQFGFLLDASIDARLSLIKIISEIEYSSVQSFYTVTNALGDRGFLDIWFEIYYDSANDAGYLGAILLKILIIAYGAYYGLAHACMISVAYVGLARSPSRSSVFKFMILGSLVLMIASHVLFYWTGVNPNRFFQPTIAIITIITTYFFTQERFALITQKDPENKQEEGDK